MEKSRSNTARGREGLEKAVRKVEGNLSWESDTTRIPTGKP
jgi:hypothetical protein